MKNHFYSILRDGKQVALGARCFTSVGKCQFILALSAPTILWTWSNPTIPLMSPLNWHAPRGQHVTWSAWPISDFHFGKQKALLCSPHQIQWAPSNQGQRKSLICEIKPDAAYRNLIGSLNTEQIRQQTPLVTFVTKAGVAFNFGCRRGNVSCSKHIKASLGSPVQVSGLRDRKLGTRLPTAVGFLCSDLWSDRQGFETEL